jgi:ATP-dependent RNA helicase DDX35
LLLSKFNVLCRYDLVKERFAVAEGDAVTALNIHAAYCKVGGGGGGAQKQRNFAQKNMLSHRALAGLYNLNPVDP